MRHKPSNYPVGATWEAKNNKGQTGRIELREKSKFMDTWYWSVWYQDGNGSGSETDWNPSYQMCREEIPLWNSDGSPIRFKRIK